MAPQKPTMAEPWEIPMEFELAQRNRFFGAGAQSPEYTRIHPNTPFRAQQIHPSWTCAGDQGWDLASTSSSPSSASTPAGQHSPKTSAQAPCHSRCAPASAPPSTPASTCSSRTKPLQPGMGRGFWGAGSQCTSSWQGGRGQRSTAKRGQEFEHANWGATLLNKILGEAICGNFQTPPEPPRGGQSLADESQARGVLPAARGDITSLDWNKLS